MNIPQSRTHLKDEYYSWLNKNQFLYRQIISEAIDAIYRIHHSSEVTKDDLSSIQSGLELPYLLSYPFGEYCFFFAITHPEIEDLLARVSQHSKASVRRNMVITCFYNQPERLINSILKNGLDDRSKSVRLKSIDVIYRMNKKSLMHNIKGRIPIENNAEVKRELENAFSLMDLGYAIDASANLILVKLKDGGTTGVYLSSVDVTNKRELESVVMEARKRNSE